MAPEAYFQLKIRRQGGRGWPVIAAATRLWVARVPLARAWGSTLSGEPLGWRPKRRAVALQRVRNTVFMQQGQGHTSKVRLPPSPCAHLSHAAVSLCLWFAAPTPLAVAPKSSQPGGDLQLALGAWQDDGQGDWTPKGAWQGGGKGKGKGRNQKGPGQSLWQRGRGKKGGGKKGGGKGSAASKAQQKLPRETPDGRSICFALNREGCQQGTACTLVHVCRKCFGEHRAVKGECPAME